VCEDYRAGAFVDPGHDAADRAAGRRLAMPVLAVWEDPGDLELPFDPAAVWRSWADDLQTLVLPGGHFLREAQPTDLTDAIAKLLAADPPDSPSASRKPPGARRRVPQRRAAPVTW
jgi:haloacetate dehalogenase